MKNIITKIKGFDEKGNKVCRIYLIPEGIFMDVAYPPVLAQELVDMGLYRPLRADEEALIVQSGRIFQSVAALEYGLQQLKVEKARRVQDLAPWRTKNDPALLSAAVYAEESRVKTEAYDDVVDVIIRFHL